MYTLTSLGTYTDSLGRHISQTAKDRLSQSLHGVAFNLLSKRFTWTVEITIFMISENYWKRR